MNLHHGIFLVMVSSCLCSLFAGALGPTADELATARQWTQARLLGEPPVAVSPGLEVIANHDPVQKNGRFEKPLKLGDTEYVRGLYCHADGQVLVRLPGPGKTFSAVVGVDNNENTSSGSGSVVFSVSASGTALFRSDVLRGAEAGVPISVELAGATEFVLEVSDSGDGISADQADWADAKVTLADGGELWLADLPMAGGPALVEPVLPFSFTYDGRTFADLVAQWPASRAKKALDDGRTQYVMSWSDPDTGLVVRAEAVAYHDFATVEWTVYLKNTGVADTPIIEEVQALDIGMERGDRGEFLLHHFVGSPCQINDYEPLETPLTGGMTKTVSGARGRATSSDLCYFNVESTCGDGLIIGLGWPGQWSASFIRDDAKKLRIRAGQENTHFILHPGEEVRTPLVALQFWKGDWINAQNLWRRWMIAHTMPRPGGKAVVPFVTADTSAQYGEMINADEAKQIYFIDRYLEEQLPIDYWWMDAGWYPCDGSWPKTGTWEVDKTRFPRGLRAVSDHAHRNGIDIIVWFEPERVAADTWLSNTHPEWIFGGKEGGLLNLGNPDALNWLIDHVDKLLTEEGIDLYRQDFNMDPLDHWRGNDAPDRQGITENKHIVGLFQYWDTLRSRHPDLLIDTCASGGRRNDLETLRRAVPLWRTDFPFNPIATQCHTYGISFWIPFSGTGVKVIDNYDFRSNAAPEFTCHWDLRDKGLDYALMRRQLADWRRYAPNFMGDYYPLTPYSTDSGVWMAWQFDRPEAGEGMVQVFRREGSIYDSARLPLRGLDPDASYNVQNIDEESVVTVSGRDLMEPGLQVTPSQRPCALVYLYKKAGA